MADYSDLKLPNALFELLKKTATKLHEQQLLFYTGMAGFISLALLTPHNSTLSMTELIHTRIGLHQLMVCLLMMHLHHSLKDSVFSAYLPPVFRWRTIQKSPKSKPYRIRIYPGKIIVATALILLVMDGTIKNYEVIAAIIILTREILISGLREFLAKGKIKLPVSNLAKAKTFLQMFSISILLTGDTGNKIINFQDYNAQTIGIIFLWFSAFLTLYTGYDYLRKGIDHAISEDEKN